MGHFEKVMDHNFVIINEVRQFLHQIRTEGVPSSETQKAVWLTTFTISSGD